MPSKLAKLIAQEEGYGIPGAVPTTHNNPGDLRHSPHSFHKGDPNAIGQIDTAEDGWADLERQLQLYADRGLNLAQAIYEFAPPTENHSAAYLKFICDGLVLGPTASVAEALCIPAPQEKPVINPRQSSQTTVMVGLIASLLVPKIQRATGITLSTEDVAALIGLVCAAWHYGVTVFQTYFPPPGAK